MMSESYYVGVYWGPRKETALECAQRAELFFSTLAQCDSTFTRWFYGGRRAPRELPGHPIPPDAKELEKLLSKWVNRTDVGKKIIEDLGFSQYMWNAKKDPTYLSMACGGYSPWGPPNSCLLTPTRETTVRERLINTSVMTEVLTHMARAWDPDFGMAGSIQMLDLIERRPGEVRLGWLTYLSARLGRLPPLPAPVRIEPVEKLGWLLTLSPEPMTASNPEHVAFTARVRELLDRAGLIERPEAPPEPWTE